MTEHRRVPGPARTMSDRRNREVAHEERARAIRQHVANYANPCPPIEWGALEARVGPLTTTRPFVRLIDQGGPRA